MSLACRGGSYTFSLCFCSLHLSGLPLRQGLLKRRFRLHDDALLVKSQIESLPPPWAAECWGKPILLSRDYLVTALGQLHKLLTFCNAATSIRGFFAILNPGQTNSQAENFSLLATPYGQVLRWIALTCNEWRSLSSRSNLYARGNRYLVPGSLILPPLEGVVRWETLPENEVARFSS